MTSKAAFTAYPHASSNQGELSAADGAELCALRVIPEVMDAF